MKLSKSTIIIGASILAVAGGVLGYYLLTKDTGEVESWVDSNWLYRKSVTVSNPGSTLTNEDVLITVDSSTLISANKLQGDCDDFRFIDSDQSTYLDYWVEGGCNTSSTQVWVQIPSLPNGETTIYMYYGNTEAINAEESWSGDFIVLSSSTCPTGWTRASDYDDKYTYGSDTYGTVFAGTHNHGQASGTTGYAIGGTQQQSDYDPEDTLTAAMHTAHDHANAKVDVDDTTIEPLYVGLYFCINNSLSQFTNSIGIFDTTSTTLPTEYTYYSTLEGKFPRGSSSFVASGGSSTHTHTTTGGYVTDATAVADPSTRMARDTGRTTAAVTHTHTTINGTTESGDNNTPYYDVVYGQTASDITASAGIIEMTSAVPPLGWTRFTSLDSKFPRGATTAGGSYSGATHTHSITITTGIGSASATGVWYTSGTKYVSYDHTHTATVTSSAVQALPAYISTIFVQRKDSTTTLLGEEVAANTQPNQPSSLKTEAQTNPTGITDTTPEFNATFTDPDSADTGNYYQIEVNTTSSFDGTSMWDSTKTTFSPVIVNGAQSSDIAYAGTTLGVGATYYWRIKFWDNNTDFNESDWSATANFTMNTYPTAPTIPYCQGASNPVKVSSSTPTFSAIFNDPDSSDTGIYYQIEVNTTSGFDGTSMWDSTKISLTSITNGLRSENITYAGSTLVEGQTYYWRIKFWDNNDNEGILSSVSHFVMAGIPDTPTNLKTNGVSNPEMLTNVPPLFTATYSDPNGDSASAYEIEVNTNTLFTGTVMWDSGKTSTTILTGHTSSPYLYNGTAMSNSDTILYWRIRFWDTDDTVSEWSAVAQFTDLYSSTYFEGLNLDGLQIN